MVDVNISFKITKCRQCRHIDHSGAFTKGGARTICGHSDACKVRRSKHALKDEYRSYYTEMVKDRWSSWKYHWFHRILDNPDYEVPDWCPLLHGSSY